MFLIEINVMKFKSSKLWGAIALVTNTSIALLLSTPATLAQDFDLESLRSRATLLGDVGGYRSQLHEAGVDVNMHYFSTLMTNVSGGLEEGTAYKGNFTVGAVFDLEKMLGLQGGHFFVSGFNHHGDSVSRRYIGDSLGNRKDDVEDSTHLFELGYEQLLFEETLSIKFGQLAVTSDFFGSAAGFFVHDSFNWQPNGQSGAPAGPDSALGLRIKYSPTTATYVQAAVYDNGTSGGFGSDQNDKHGISWSAPTGNRAVWFVEGGLAPSSSQWAGWPLLKIGGWLSEAPTTDLLSGASASSNWGLYLIGEKMLWTEEQASAQGLEGFFRCNWSTPDRNQFAWELNVGLLYTGLIANRDEDVLGLGFTHAEVSDDWQKVNASGASEQAFELKYRAKLVPWWNVEPFAQYILNPGLPNGRNLNDSLVFGLASSITF